MVSGNFHVEFMSRVLCSFPSPRSPSLHAVLNANLYSDIKPDDFPVKGTKRGKGKKDKKKSIDAFERRKPKLDELKVLGAAATIHDKVVQV